jgi:hypothetical protein
MSQIQSPCGAMCDNPFIVHEFFCAQKRGTRRSAKREQTRITIVAVQRGLFYSSLRPVVATLRLNHFKQALLPKLLGLAGRQKFHR